MTVSDYTYQRPWIPPEIESVIFDSARIVVVEGATKTAKTTTSMLWLSEQAMLSEKPGRNYWWVSSVYGTSSIAYERLKRGFPPGLMHARDDKLTITLPNESVLHFRSAEKPDNLFGSDVYAAVGDEVSRWRETAWHALRTTLTATRAPVRLVHNVKGRQNFAYKMARRAEAGEPDMKYAVFTAYDAVRWGLLDAQEVEDARRQLPEDVFNELYLCRPLIRVEILSDSLPLPVLWSLSRMKNRPSGGSTWPVPWTTPSRWLLTNTDMYVGWNGGRHHGRKQKNGSPTSLGKRRH